MSFRSSAAAPWRKPTEKKSHLWRADSAGEITSRKGRSSPSSSPSSRASSRSSSTSSPSSAPSPSSSNLVTIATRVVIRTTYPLYSIGVDYYFVVNAIEFCWRNIIVFRFFYHLFIPTDHDLFYVL